MHDSALEGRWRSMLEGRWRSMLEGRWRSTLTTCGATVDATGSEWTDLTRRYREPIRRYHTLHHLGEVFGALERLEDAEHARDADWHAIRLAAFYHDAVYDPRADDNESQSAELARRRLGALGLRAELLDEIARLVELTSGHAPDVGDVNGELLVDADLAILGAPAGRYDDYRRAVRAEYSHLDDESWSTGRASVLETLLERPTVYSTGPALTAWESRARENLGGELALLRSTG